MKITNETKIYIAGCGGMLGEAVFNTFSKKCQVKATDIDLNEPWLSYGDVRDYDKISKDILSFQPHAIINLAALTDLEFCEKDAENAWLTNGLGAENLGLVANQLGIPYVYISTAGIFDGKQEVYSDFDIPVPLSIYAKSKHYGESFVSRSVQKYFIFRAGWMMGGGVKKDKKFINKIFKQISSGAKKLYIVDDKLGTPTYTFDFAKGILRMLETDLYGIYNQVCGGSGSRHDVAVEFVRLLGLQNEIEIEKVSSDHFKGEYFAPRPASEKLVNLKLNQRGLNVMRDWHVCLEEYAQVFKAALRPAQRTALKPPPRPATAMDRV